VAVELQGAAPRTDAEREQYLAKKLEELRKDCQWLLGLGAVGVLSVVLKEHTGSVFRFAVALVSTGQILISMAGAMSWLTADTDKAAYEDALSHRLRTRYVLRNASVALLALSYILILALALGSGSKLP
jgi:hypothetical protein